MKQRKFLKFQLFLHSSVSWKFQKFHDVLIWSQKNEQTREKNYFTNEIANNKFKLLSMELHNKSQKWRKNFVLTKNSSSDFEMFIVYVHFNGRYRRASLLSIIVMRNCIVKYCFSLERLFMRFSWKTMASRKGFMEYWERKSFFLDKGKLFTSSRYFFNLFELLENWVVRKQRNSCCRTSSLTCKFFKN